MLAVANPLTELKRVNSIKGTYHRIRAAVNGVQGQELAYAKRNIMPAMASLGRESESLNIQLLVDSIPALIHTSRPDGYLDYFNKPWLEYLGVTLDEVAGWKWKAFAKILVGDTKC
jgi:PAS domain-containing protein